MSVRRETRVGRAEGPWRATAPPATSSGRCRTRCWPANSTAAASWAISTWPRCPEPQPDALWAWLTLDDPPAPRDGRHVPGHHGAEWPRGTRRQGPRLADRARSAGTVCKTIRARSNCALVCLRCRPASGTSPFTMRTDVVASDPPSDSARSSRRRPIRGARGESHRLRSPIPIHSRTVHWVRWNPMQNEGWSEGNENQGIL